MSFDVWMSGIVCAKNNARYATGLWDRQELAEYALGQLLEDTEPGFWAETFVYKVSINSTDKVFTSLVDWNIGRWAAYVKIMGLTPEIVEKLQRIELIDSVLDKLSVQQH